MACWRSSACPSSPKRWVPGGGQLRLPLLPSSPASSAAVDLVETLPALPPPLLLTPLPCPPSPSHAQPASSVALDLVEVRHVMAAPVVSLRERVRLGDVRDLLRRTRHNGFAVVRDTPQVCHAGWVGGWVVVSGWVIN